MKKYICYLLIALLLLAGCGSKETNTEEKVEVSVIQQVEESIENTPVPPVEATGEQPAQPAIQGYEGFLNALSAAVIDGKGNKNLSPISVYLAVAMAAEGAQGETLSELLALLGADSLEDLRRNAEAMIQALSVQGRDSELMLANSLWMGMQDGEVAFREDYLKTLADSYDATADAVPFGEAAAQERIAAWIREKTRDKITISEDALHFNADTLAVLINTIYLKDGWRTPFEKDYTEEGTFYGLDEELRVNYMARTATDTAIVRGEGYLRYALALNEVGRMVFILPDEGVALDALLGSPERIDELLHGGEEKNNVDVHILLPKFTFQDRTDLEETLMGLGVKTCFTGDADFSAMTSVPAHISRILQESRIGVDENGVEAAAYTMIVMPKSAAFSIDREKVDFHLTRPFLYAIESRDGTVLFLGTVTAPDKAK